MYVRMRKTVENSMATRARERKKTRQIASYFVELSDSMRSKAREIMDGEPGKM